MPSRPATQPVFAVAGAPILGSLSAPLYRALFARLGVTASYTRLSCDTAPEALALARELALSGINATSPIKEQLPALLDELTPDAGAAGAVNVAMGREGGGWLGDNTDVTGVVSALELAGVSARDTRVSVLGAGGAARAVIVALTRAGFRGLTVCNRGRARAVSIQEALGVPTVGLDALEDLLTRTDLLISCVPGDPGIVPAAWLRPGSWVLDADYRAEGLVRAARLAGCRVIPGVDWLALQAAANGERFLAQAIDESTRSWLCRQAAQPRPSITGPVVLAGFSGAGKSTVGPILARLLGWGFVDSDRDVEREAGAPVHTIFERDGETAFRERERRAVARALAHPRTVVSLGGGALLDPATRARLAERGLCVLLHAPLETCLARLEPRTRPLLGPDGDAQALWSARRPGYLQAAELVVATGDRPAEAVARRIRDELEAGAVLTGGERVRILEPGFVRGAAIQPPRSKSHGIRLLCAAALAPGDSVLEHPPRCADFTAAVGICEQLGARVRHRKGRLEVRGIGGAGPRPPEAEPVVLDCGESALCMRLFAAVAAFLGGSYLLEARGSLRTRNMRGLIHALDDLGVRCSADDGRPPLTVHGPPVRDRVLLDASGSSQVLSGLLMAAPLLARRCHIEAKGLVSRPYVKLTVDALASAGVRPRVSAGLDHFALGEQGYRPFTAAVECDWSALAMLLVAAATTGRIELADLPFDSAQGDAIIVDLLSRAGACVARTGDRLQVERRPLRAFAFDATHHPDLFPPLAVLAAACEGRSEISGVGRLRNKESDRALALQQELGALGVAVQIEGDRMVVVGGPVGGGEVDAHGDHRIAMALAVLALRASAPVRLRGAQHVAKSYPGFFHDLQSLCGGTA